MIILLCRVGENIMAKASSLKNKTVQNISKNPDCFWEKICCGFLLFIVFLSMFNQGLLYERQYIPVLILTSAVCCVGIAKLLLDKQQTLRLACAPILFCFFSFAAAVSLVNAANAHDAFLTMCKYISAFLAVFLVSQAKTLIPLKRWFIYGLGLSGAAVAILGVDAIWGSTIVNLINRLFNGGALPAEGTGFFFSMIIDNRLSSVYQYPNTTAVYLLAAWLAASYLGMADHSGKWLKPPFWLAAAFVNFYAFILTISRGAFIVAGIIIVMYLFLTPQHRRKKTAITACLTVLPAILLGVFSFPDAQLRNASIPVFWLILVFAAALVAVGGMTLLPLISVDEGQAKKPKKVSKYRKFLLPGILALIILILALGCLIWLSSRPLTLDGTSPTYRRNLTLEAGDYLLTASFAEDLDSSVDNAAISLQSQNRQEMIVNQYPTIISAKLSDYAGQKEILIPFTLEDTVAQRININPAGMSGENALVSLFIEHQGTGAVHQVRLGRPFLSETVIWQIENIFYTRTAFTRFSFYQDALEIFQDYPLTGAGGYGWEHLYGRYQKYYYVANDLHSYGAQLLVENGILGIAMLAGMLILFLLALIAAWIKRDPEQITLLLAVGAIFAHSMIDVDFAFFSQLIIFALGVSLLDFGGLEEKISALKNTKALKIAAAVLLLISLPFTIYFPWRMQLASVNAERYAYASMDKESTSALYYIEKAAARDPFKTEYAVSLAQTLVSGGKVTQTVFDSANALVEQALEKGRFSADTLRLAREYYFSTAQFEKADEVAVQLVETKPLRKELWEDYAEFISRILLNVEAPEKKEQRALWLEKGLAIPERMSAASEGKWVPVVVTDTIQEELDNWQEELAAMALS